MGKDEPNQLGIVLAVGLDKGEKGVHLTTEVARPMNASQLGGTGRTSLVLGTDAPSVPEAVEKLQGGFSRKLFWADDEILLVGEDLARSGLDHELEYFKTLHSFHRRVWLLVVPGRAADLLRSAPAIEHCVADEVRRSVERRIGSGPNQTTDLNDFCFAETEPGLDPIAPLVKRGPSGGLDMSKAAVFRRDRMVGVLGPHEVQGYALWKGGGSAGMLVAKTKAEGMVALKLDTAKARHRLEKGAATIVADIALGGTLEEATASSEVWGEAGAKAALREVEAAIAASRRQGSDFLGLGEEVFRERPQLWSALDRGDRGYLAEIPVRVRVRLTVNSTGSRRV